MSTSNNNNGLSENDNSDYMKQHEGMKWKLNQVFGEDPTAVNEGKFAKKLLICCVDTCFLENVITSVEFDPSGEFLSIGYQCGQVVIFRNQTGGKFNFAFFLLTRH